MRFSHTLMISTAIAVAALFVACGDSDDASTNVPARDARSVQRYDANGARLDGPAPSTTRPNLVVVVIDTLRADAVAHPDHSASVMPYLHELSSQGVCCARAFSPSAWTEPAMASMLTGMMPREHGCIESLSTPRIPATVVTYAEVLRNAYGYETAAFTDSAWYRNQPWSILQGFNRGSRSAGFASMSLRPMERGYGLGVTDDVLDDWLRERDASRPFCLLLHSFDAHDPYGAANRPTRTGDLARAEALFQKASENFPIESVRTPRDFARVMLTSRVGRDRLFKQYGHEFSQTVARYMVSGFEKPEDKLFAGEMRGAYERGARWVDGQLRGAIEALEERGLLENTLLVVTSDHGEAFGEHGTLGHGHDLHAETTHVPLILLGPGPFVAPRILDQTVSLLDVFPTFFDWAGIDVPTEVHGRSLLPALRGDLDPRTVASETLVTEHMAGPGARQLWMARRSDEWTFMIAYDIRAGTVTEQLFRADDLTEAHDLAVDGQILNVDVGDAFCEAIDEAREAVWSEVDAAQKRAGTVYGVGIEFVRTTRPQPCGDALRNRVR